MSGEPVVNGHVAGTKKILDIWKEIELEVSSFKASFFLVCLELFWERLIKFNSKEGKKKRRSNPADAVDMGPIPGQ